MTKAEASSSLSNQAPEGERHALDIRLGLDAERPLRQRPAHDARTSQRGEWRESPFEPRVTASFAFGLITTIRCCAVIAASPSRSGPARRSPKQVPSERQPMSDPIYDVVLRGGTVATAPTSSRPTWPCAAGRSRRSHESPAGPLRDRRHGQARPAGRRRRARPHRAGLRQRHAERRHLGERHDLGRLGGTTR